MGIVHVMELVLIIILAVLSCILVFKLLYKLRSTLPWRVNCWFCNGNFWVKFLARNSWTCPKCDQYNGFTKEGDYNKPIITNNDQNLSPRVFQKSPPRNGLCKMCNINQQLKVAQLASFVPMREKNYDEEIDIYRTQLEKAYKLCSPCKRVLQLKLHKEKETLLATKQLEKRSSDKNGKHKEKQNSILKSFINNTSTFIATILIIIVATELYKNVQSHKNIPSSIANIKQITKGLFERIVSIVKMKALMTFPQLENYLIDVNVLFDKMPEMNLSSKDLNSFTLLTQQALGGIVCFVQIIGHVWNVYKLKYSIAIDLLWSVFVISAMAHHAAIDPLLLSLMKLFTTSIVLLIYRSMKNKPVKMSRMYTTPKRMKNLINGSKTSSIDDDDNLSFDTDDDVSLSKFGLRNFSDSSADTISPLGASLNNGRTFTPRGDSLWTKPKHNSTFCINSVISKSPSSVSETVFAKPSFNKYQKFNKDDSDSDLDESISSLCISSPKKGMRMNPIFSLRKFTPTPSFVAGEAARRPLISPSKLGHGTSWVAGGYWGADAPALSAGGSRSSSQSSGFESQASSVTQRNVFSQPPSRAGSACGEPMLVDPQPFAAPVFPQMQYDGHVHIPQPRFPPHPRYVQNPMFKTPGGSGLIKLPRANSFASN
ncbi:uncharacterized protein LOC128683700 [Plodia interpunctella]|uniref:uncharacterized protein LOC128683700 n=1 Tax=Plodia interpunctella TaxID=58824 RepID=UPI002367A974|nr:uncharacterized protein LOC128683700 [Plodia interpunctella]